ncbi:helix-turn-helix domain-containing protein [Natronosalvus halobius]|uniref:helix-turn-helix domain-containing protein n=1 Tax=Natronosalvus halobius TaxID=2953746 RepID=UPI0020A206C7|nr:helix-turn-helix domain-containing protein [Natronosalvus halobius]USZ72485.1 helix-turn-helix domain-containing protein [Natronosalvus halobius]
MTSDNTDERRVPDESDAHPEAGEGEATDASPRGSSASPGDTARTEAGTPDRTKTADEVDQRIVDLLSWILDTETRAKIYIHLLANPGSTSEEVSRGTGLYPSTVREALAELHGEDRVSRQKRASGGAGNNPYEYTAIQPSELVGGVLDQVQRELNTIFTLDRLLDREKMNDETVSKPVTIVVDDSNDFHDSSGSSASNDSNDLTDSNEFTDKTEREK